MTDSEYSPGGLLPAFDPEPSKKERLAEFLRRLREARPCADGAAALQIVRVTLDRVEDELTSIPNNAKDPAVSRTDGRLYPPQDDAARPVREGVTRYRSRRHNTFVGENGAIEIKDLSGATALDEPGADGRRVSEL